MIKSEANRYYSEEYKYQHVVSYKGKAAKNDYEMLTKLEHINMMFQDHINIEIDEYFQTYLEHIKHESRIGDIKTRCKLYFDSVINSYTVEKTKYTNCLNMDKINSFKDYNVFKKWISDECPIIWGCRNSRNKVMTKWKTSYNCLHAEELYKVIEHIVDFANNYHKKTDLDEYKYIDDWEAFNLSEIEDGKYYLGGVIGTGIVSTILYHLYPDVFSGNFKMGLWSLYFLTNKSVTGMSGDSSEFVMVVDDTYEINSTILQKHNFYYPYYVYLLYSLRIYRILHQKLEENFYSFPDEYRHVLCDDFFLHCCQIREDDIGVFNALDDLEKQGKLVLP